LLIGICASALGAVVVFAYPGQSQLYYLKGAAGAFGLLTAAGLKQLLPDDSLDRRVVGMAMGAAVVGAITILAFGILGPRAVPTIARVQMGGVLAATIPPVVALVIVAALAWALLAWAERRRAVPRGAVPVLVVALVMGFSLPAAWNLLLSPVTGTPPTGPAIPAEGIAAARWLRDHSDSSDLVATNLHCLTGKVVDGACDARHFWVSAFAERRMLVEGWAYTPLANDYGVAHGVSGSSVPFWDPARLAANDAAFVAPTVESLAALRDSYGVRWLFADLGSADAESLDRLADLRHREGAYGVYELRAP
jgi:hypothetical protein